MKPTEDKIGRRVTMEVAKTHTDCLPRIKQSVQHSYEYYRHNYDRYNEFRRFIFDSSLRESDITLLTTVSKPQLEFNILEAYLSRLLGEFSKQEPDIMVKSDNENQVDPLIVEFVEQHLRHTLSDKENHHNRYEVYKDLLSGGFSVLKVRTDYLNPMSMDQVIKIERCYDPTLCGFDMLSRYSHKGDGRFCFELFPMSKEDFESEYPDVDISKVTFRRDFGGFNWSYVNGSTPIIMVCDYYEKKKKKFKIVRTSDGQIIRYKKYKEIVRNWNDITAPPIIVGEPRMTCIDVICRYRLIENMILEYVETDFNHLPLIFVDGNSVLLKTPKDGNVRQFTRPYVYHAKGAQQLKNYSGISLANEIENTVQHKFMVAKEALPKESDYLQSYKDVQKANVVVFNSVYEEDPNLPINNPIREIHRDPAPPEIVQAFTGADSLVQNILGSYDASLGINNNQLSGVAIVEAASQSNATAMPYIVGLLDGYQRAAQVYVDLMPKYYTTPRTMPIMDKDGKRSFVKINQNDGLDISYESNTMNVCLKAGASFQVQKSRTLMMVKEMMGMSPLFAQFISEKGLNFILDNMEGRSIDKLKEMVDEWTKEMEQQKQNSQMMQQQAMQNNPALIKAKNEQVKIQQQAMENQQKIMIDMNKLKLDENKILADIENTKNNNLVQVIKANTERFSKQVELELSRREQHYNQVKDAINNYHRLTKGSVNETNAYV